MTPPCCSRVAGAGLSLAVAACVTFGTGAARAQAGATQAMRSSARALADEGADAFARGDFERAHDRLEQAFLLVEAPTIAVLDARALVKLGRLVEARAVYRQALDAPVTDASPPAFREAVESARAESRLLEPRLAWLTIRIGQVPADARVQVRLDGAEVAPHVLGAPFAVDPKMHGAQLDVDGVRVAARRIALREGERRTVELEAPSRGGLSRALVIAGYGAGGAGLLTGIVAGSLALSARTEAARDCPARRCTAGSSGAQALDDFRTFRTVSTVGYAVGIGGAALGTVMLLTRSGSNDVEVGVAPSLGGVNVEGTF